MRGSGQTRVGAGNLHHSFAGNFRGTATLNAGTLSLAGDFNADGKVDAADYVVWRMHYHDAGVIDLATRQFRPHMFSNIVIDWGDGNPQPN